MSTHTKENKSGRIILVIVGLLVLSAMGYFATQYFSKKKQAEAQQITIGNLRDDLTKLEADIVSLQNKIDDKNTSLKEKDALIAERDASIGTLQRKLKQAQNAGKLKNTEISEVSNRLKLLNNQLGDYTEKITKLETRVARQSDTIALQRTHVARQESTLQDLGELAETQAGRLKQAARLSAANFGFLRVKSNGKEIEDVIFRRGSLEVLKICFDLLPNAEAKTGLIPVTLRIYKPDGSMYSDVNTQSNYRSEGQRACIPFSFPGKPEKGVYETIILDGQLRTLGVSQFEVK